ncbi:hypothetical protein [Kushneria aurantia]|uniref:Uncharacterized protein n=1 Tax=Kushneria aurantia TaxID=504092 RepID=A0ABV6G6B5_9GAMM|nr:hypothetical protein [Kushneria aurantia]
MPHASESSSQQSDSQEKQPTTLSVGLIPAPELPEALVASIVDELSDLFESHVDNRYQWQVQSETDPLIGAEESTDEMLYQARRMRRDREWDYVICVTDLPIYRNNRLVIAEASEAYRVALISQPALGASPMRKRLREAVIHLLNEMHHGSSEQARERQQSHNRHQLGARRRHGLRNNNARHLLGQRLSELIAPIQRISPQKTDDQVSVRFTARWHFTGRCKLLAGMVRANRPWSIFPTFRKVIAVAFATGAYALLLPSLWRLGDAYEPWRFVVLMIGSLAAMVIWIVIVHGLWEPQRHRHAFPMATLYNLTTLITLSIGVLFYYAMLLVMFLVSVIIFVPPGLLAQVLGHAISPWHYPSLAWLAASVATVAGALGSGLESDTRVRAATYGYRQQSRQQRVRQLTEDNSKQES